MTTQSKRFRKVAIPWMGKAYIELLARSLTEVGIHVQLPPPTTDRTIQIGVRNTAEMVCFPLKPTLGNFVEALENGADTLLMFDSRGQCRLRHYWKIQEFVLRNMGYEFQMVHLNFKNAVSVLKKLGGVSTLKILKEVFRFYNKVEKIDAVKERWADDRPNIGIIGEMFTCCDERINYGIEEKIYHLGAKPVNTVNLSSFIKESVLQKIHWPSKNKYNKAARRYLNGELGGHGRQNIANLLALVDKNIGGVIHLLPMSCMPETSIEPFVNEICRDSNTPLLRIPIDENTAEANLETRLETFVELIKMRGQQ
jgi:predicted nucleotide-binding protein (sugar kinase/HSP70/actin superfamily)